MMVCSSQHVEDFAGCSRAQPSDRKLMIRRREGLGLLIFDRCTADELRAFCTSRGLECPAKARTLTQVAALRITCTSRLEGLDNNGCTFGKLLKVPPEIRIQIYQWYRLWLKKSPRGHPLLVAVNRLVREESMPILFDSFFFNCYHRSDLGARKPPITLTSPVTRRFFSKVPDTFLMPLRRLDICAPLGAGRDALRWDNGIHLVWEFDLRGKTRDTRVVLADFLDFDDKTRDTRVSADFLDVDANRNDIKPQSQIENARVMQAENETVNAIRKALMDLADSILARPQQQFRRDDSRSIVKALNAKPARKRAGIRGG